jgi:DNA mismatch endonuclease, patch repair protein
MTRKNSMRSKVESLVPFTMKPTTGRTEHPYLRDGRAPIPELEATSRVMSSNRGKNTGPELALRRELVCQGVRGYHLHAKAIPGRPDLAFSKSKIAVFVNGCFWHHCPRCNLPIPKSHSEFWRAKFEANRRRDSEKTNRLIESGWRVITLWECEIRDNPTRAAKRVRRAVTATS